MYSYAKAISCFMKREDGPTAVEYAAIIALIALACVAVIAFVGSGASDLFTEAGSGAGTGP